MSTEVKAPEIEFRLVDGAEARVLDPAQLEWPLDSKVIFAIQNGEVIARTSKMILPVAIIPFDMIEGTWIREDRRNGTLAVRLIKMVEQVFKDHGKTHAFAFTYDDQPEVGQYLARLGYKPVPFSVWQKQLVED